MNLKEEIEIALKPYVLDNVTMLEKEATFQILAIFEKRIEKMIKNSISIYERAIIKECKKELLK